MKNYQFLQQRYLLNTYPNRGLNLIRGEGVYLYDENNNQYLDVMTNYGVNIFGYHHSQINNQLINQINKLPSLHCSFTNEIRAEASFKLVKRCGEDYYQVVYWSNSGAEAIEAALKFVVLSSGKKKFIVAKNSYHGKTLGALSATSEKYHFNLSPLLWNFTAVPYNNIDAIKKAIDQDTAAVLIELIQGEGGIIVSDKDYLKKIEQICQDKKILLIFDEIQTGTGRTGYFLASQEFNISADIVCLGKGLAGGIPVGATVLSQKVASKISRNTHSSTFGGNPLACAGVLAVLELLDKKALESVRNLGKYFISSLKKINHPLIHEVRGKGLMIGIAVKDKRNLILKNLQSNNVLAIPAGDDVVRFLPSYIIEKKQIDIVVDKLKIVLKTI